MSIAAIVLLVAAAPHPACEEGAAPAFDPLDAEHRIATVAHGCDLLLAMQESLAPGGDGPLAEWPYEGVYRVRGEIPIGYRIGGTAIAATALLAAPGEDERRDAAIERALAFVLTALDDPRMVPATEYRYDVRGWGHTYALEFLLRLEESARFPAALRDAALARTKWLIDALQRSAIPERGGWAYSRGDNPRPSPFMTAPTLQALFTARRLGHTVDEAVVERALDALESARLDDGSFQYAAAPRRGANENMDRIPGAIGRMPVAETTLHLAGRGSLERVRAAVAAFFEHWDALEARRQQNGTHEPPYGVAPYYFFYAHRYAAQAIEILPADERPALRARLYALYERVREPSGGWNDRVFPRSENYGTATTILALAGPDLPPPAGWSVAAKAGRK